MFMRLFSRCGFPPLTNGLLSLAHVMTGATGVPEVHSCGLDVPFKYFIRLTVAQNRWQASSYSTDQKVPYVLRNFEVSREPVTGPYPEADGSNRRTLILFLKINSNIVLPFMPGTSTEVCFLQVFPPKPYMNSLTWMPTPRPSHHL